MAISHSSVTNYQRVSDWQGKMAWPLRVRIPKDMQNPRDAVPAQLTDCLSHLPWSNHSNQCLVSGTNIDKSWGKKNIFAYPCNPTPTINHYSYLYSISLSGKLMVDPDTPQLLAPSGSANDEIQMPPMVLLRFFQGEVS